MTDLDPLFLNIIYVATGGIMVLFFMWMGCKLFSHIVNFSIPDKLAEGNIAVGIMIAGMFIGIGTALVIGMGLN